MSDISKLIKSILSGETKLSSLSKEQLETVEAVMQLMKAKFITPEQQKANRQKHIQDNNEAVLESASVDKPQKQEAPKKQKYPWTKEPSLKIVKQEFEKKGQEIVDYSSRGQWKICNKEEVMEKPPVSEAQRKAMWAAAKGKSDIGIPKSVGKDFADSDTGGKLPDRVEKMNGMGAGVIPNNTTPAAAPPTILRMTERGQWSIEKEDGPRTLDYGKMDPMRNPMSNPKAAKEAKAAHYANIDAKAGVLDYQNMKAPPKYTGAADRAKAVQAKLEAESKETAAETIARRQAANKAEGILEDSEPTASARGKMTAKNETMGYGAVNQPAPMTMSEKDPKTAR